MAKATSPPLIALGCVTMWAFFAVRRPNIKGESISSKIAAAWSASNRRQAKTIWSDALPRGTSNYYASPAIANGVLYAAREDGTVFTARIRDRFELICENPLEERIVASPVLANDSLLIRGDKHLFLIR